MLRRRSQRRRLGLDRLVPAGNPVGGRPRSKLRKPSSTWRPSASCSNGSPRGKTSQTPSNIELYDDENMCAEKVVAFLTFVHRRSSTFGQLRRLGNFIKRSPNSMRRMISGQRGINHVSSARFELLGQKAADGISSHCHLWVYKMVTPEYPTACRGVLRSLTQPWKFAPEGWL